jgi:hypothetical protein
VQSSRGSTQRRRWHPGLWSASRYLWHTVDVLRFGTERLWTIGADPAVGVPAWDENVNAEVRSYDDLSPDSRPDRAERRCASVAASCLGSAPWCGDGTPRGRRNLCVRGRPAQRPRGVSSRVERSAGHGGTRPGRLSYAGVTPPHRRGRALGRSLIPQPSLLTKDCFRKRQIRLRPGFQKRRCNVPGGSPADADGIRSSHHESDAGRDLGPSFGAREGKDQSPGSSTCRFRVNLQEIRAGRSARGSTTWRFGEIGRLRQFATARRGQGRACSAAGAAHIPIPTSRM